MNDEIYEAAIKNIPKKPSLIVFDFDGVFTNNKVYVFEDGREAVVCNRGDSLGTNRLKTAGFNMFILTTERNAVVKSRGEKIGITVHDSCDDKAAFLKQYISENSIAASHAIYVGNDTNDLEAMKLVGWPVCPADAHPEIKAISKLCLNKKGGDGAVRELCDLLTT